MLRSACEQARGLGLRSRQTFSFQSGPGDWKDQYTCILWLYEFTEHKPFCYAQFRSCVLRQYADALLLNVRQLLDLLLEYNNNKHN